MMPLTMARTGEINSIKKISGKTEIRQHLETLGFIIGTPVMVVADIRGNVIVKIKESRIAISREMANKIMV